MEALGSNKCVKIPKKREQSFFRPRNILKTIIQLFNLSPLKIRRKLRLCSKLVYEVFDVAGHDLVIRRSKYKITDEIWRLKISEPLRYF